MSPMHFITLFPDMMEVESRGASSSSEGGSQTLGRGTRVQIPPVYVCVTPGGSARRPKQSNTGGRFQGSNFWHEANAENS